MEIKPFAERRPNHFRDNLPPLTGRTIRFEKQRVHFRIRLLKDSLVWPTGYLALNTSLMGTARVIDGKTQTLVIALELYEIRKERGRNKVGKPQTRPD